MTLDEYQEQALSTAIFPDENSIVYPVLGLTGESGEVADKVKKTLRDNAGQFSAERKKDIALELGDVLWYAAVLARNLGYTLNDIAEMNVEKIKSRQKRNALHGSGDNR